EKPARDGAHREAREDAEDQAGVERAADASVVRGGAVGHGMSPGDEKPACIVHAGERRGQPEPHSDLRKSSAAAPVPHARPAPDGSPPDDAGVFPVHGSTRRARKVDAGCRSGRAEPRAAVGGASWVTESRTVRNAAERDADAGTRRERGGKRRSTGSTGPALKSSRRRTASGRTRPGASCSTASVTAPSARSRIC